MEIGTEQPAIVVEPIEDPFEHPAPIEEPVEVPEPEEVVVGARGWSDARSSVVVDQTREAPG